jgi:hypothetical protein
LERHNMRKQSTAQLDTTAQTALSDLLPVCDVEPNTELAIVLLASGQTQQYVRQQCGFETLRDVQAFARDDDVRAAVKEQRAQRVQRIGDCALVSLEKIVNAEHKDLRAQVLAIRTALEVGGALAKDAALPVKEVSDLSVSELNELIASTKAELAQRLGEYRPDVQSLPATR